MSPSLLAKRTVFIALASLRMKDQQLVSYYTYTHISSIGSTSRTHTATLGPRRVLTCRLRLGRSIGSLLLRTRPGLVGARYNSEKGLIALPGILARWRN